MDVKLSRTLKQKLTDAAVRGCYEVRSLRSSGNRIQMTLADGRKTNFGALYLSMADRSLLAREMKIRFGDLPDDHHKKV